MTIEKDATLRHLRSAAGLGLCAALFLAGCSEEPTMPLDDTAGSERPGALADAVQRLDCTVDVSKGGDLECEPASGTSSGGPSYNLVVGSQHRFVRMANDAPVMDATTWSANVTVQNLTVQPFGTEDGENADAAGVRVFFVEEPNNGVEVVNFDDVGTFTESDPQKYYEYSGAQLGGDGILAPGETSGAKTWEFALNGATKFRFSVLVWTAVPDPGAYSVHLTRVSAGSDHTCADGSDGKLYCWGYNLYGRLGDGTRTDRSTPVVVQAPEGVTLSGVVAGEAHTCADGSDGKVYCWGLNFFGQLGDGTNTERWTPVAVQAPEGVVLSGVVAGAWHTCAHGSDDELYCWGANADGQLGDGTTTDRSTPVAVQAPAGVMLSGVVAGGWHTCAHGSDGKLYCWGWNVDGQLGDGTNTSRLTPVPVQAPEGVVLSGVSARRYHTCAEGSDGKLYCWGYNSSGQLGDGTTTDRSTPVAVQAPEGVVLSGVVAGGAHTCADGSDGKVYCWGNNGSGQLGDGTTTNRWTPLAVQAPAGVVLSGVSAGEAHTCARSTAGPVYCWGGNGSGQLGDGRTTDSNLPVIVAATR